MPCREIKRIVSDEVSKVGTSEVELQAHTHDALNKCVMVFLSQFGLTSHQIDLANLKCVDKWHVYVFLPQRYYLFFLHKYHVTY